MFSLNVRTENFKLQFIRRDNSTVEYQKLIRRQLTPLTNQIPYFPAMTITLKAFAVFSKKRTCLYIKILIRCRYQNLSRCLIVYLVMTTDTSWFYSKTNPFSEKISPEEKIRSGNAGAFLFLLQLKHLQTINQLNNY